MCLSPVGLSLVTKLSPKRIVGVMMGVWFLAASLGNKIAGWVAGFFDIIPVARLFTYVVVATIAGGIVLLLFSKPVKKLSGEA